MQQRNQEKVSIAKKIRQAFDRKTKKERASIATRKARKVFACNKEQEKASIKKEKVIKQQKDSLDASEKSPSKSVAKKDNPEKKQLKKEVPPQRKVEEIVIPLSTTKAMETKKKSPSLESKTTTNSKVTKLKSGITTLEEIKTNTKAKPINRYADMIKESTSNPIEVDERTSETPIGRKYEIKTTQIGVTTQRAAGIAGAEMSKP